MEWSVNLPGMPKHSICLMAKSDRNCNSRYPNLLPLPIGNGPNPNPLDITGDDACKGKPKCFSVLIRNALKASRDPAKE